MKIPQLYFISGVSGVGKSSTMRYLRQLLPADQYDIRDFDERGVPDGGGSVWHDAETQHWFDVAADNAKAGKSTVLCGFTMPEQIARLRQERHPSVRLILLHAAPEIVRERLLARESTPERIKEIERAAGKPLPQFIQDIMNFTPMVRASFERAGLPIIDTQSKTPEEVAKEVARWIKK